MNEDRSARYHRLKRRAGVASVLWSALLLLALLLSGVTGTMRALSEGLASALIVSSPAVLTIAFYVVLLALVHEAGSVLPAGYSFELERRYGMATQSWRGWFTDQVKSLALSMLFGVAAAEIVYGFIRLAPAHWWWAAGLTFAMLIVGLANLGPVLLLPLFYRVKPLQREALRARLLSLASRAGARVLGVYEWGLGKETRKANAALTGLGSTRRILVSDTMLAEYSDDEIEVVLAHELAHHVHGDIWKGLLFETALMLVGFYAVSLVLPGAVSLLHLRDQADIAGLPLLLLVSGGVAVLLMPMAHAISRAHERRADRFALALTKNPGAFVSAMRRLGAQNLAEEAPSRIVQWLFYSHPPVAERIDAARRFQA